VGLTTGLLVGQIVLENKLFAIGIVNEPIKTNGSGTRAFGMKKSGSRLARNLFGKSAIIWW